MANVNSNVKLITSNAVPTTTNLSKGELAFGQVNGENKIFGNIGDRVVEFTASGEPIIYFEDENDLNAFLAGSDVPTGGWYAAVADKVYVTTHTQAFLTTKTLGPGINPVKFSDLSSVGELNSVKSITLADEYTMALDGYGVGQTKFSIDCHVGVSKHETSIPDMQITFSFPDSTTDVWTIHAQYQVMNEWFVWKGEHTVDLSAHAATRAQLGGVTQVAANIMAYNGDSKPIMTGYDGLLKVEDA